MTEERVTHRVHRREQIGSTTHRRPGRVAGFPSVGEGDGDDQPFGPRRTSTVIASSLAATRCGGSTRRSRLDGKALRTPPVQAARQRAHPLDAPAPQDQRHPGAAGFVGSGAVQDDVAVTGDLGMAALQFVRTQTQGAGDHMRLRVEIHGMA